MFKRQDSIFFGPLSLAMKTQERITGFHLTEPVNTNDLSSYLPTKVVCRKMFVKIINILTETITDVKRVKIQKTLIGDKVNF